MRVGILGFGNENKALLKFLKKEKAYKNAEFWILDKNKNLKLPKGVKSILGENYLKDLNQFDIIFRSPGVPYNLKELVSARKKGIKISSAIKLFFEKASKKTKNIIGVTGTKGKSTTSTLIYKILKSAGKKAILAGNIGKSPLDYLNKITKNTFVVLELSSFQLQDLQFSPHIAVILDVFPDHQDSHSSLKEYFDAKSNICKHQNKNDVVFYFENNPNSKKIAFKSKGKKIAVSEKNFTLFNLNDLKIKGWHNFLNAIIASNVALYLKIPPKIILKTVKNFKGLNYRIQFVRKIKLNKNQFIEFYNDSASTNPGAGIACVLSFPQKQKIIILGGKDKNLDYTPLAKKIKKLEKEILYILLFGENKNKIYKSLKKEGARSKIVIKNNLKEVVLNAKKLAVQFLKQNPSCKEIVILFSPSSTSFDMFLNYKKRGEEFKKLVLNLKK
jgi:UDP-N-acetylmuramoylalanine--D-glutamate ligase